MLKINVLKRQIIIFCFNFFIEFCTPYPTGAEIKIDENQSTAIFANCATAVAQLQSGVYELVTNIGWVQNCIILEKCKDLKQVAFYLRQTKEKGWSKSVHSI